MTAAEILDRIRTTRVLIVGDVCLDRWCYYDSKATEQSRETCLPRFAVVRTEVTPGAAGTVANNLVALGVETVSVMGLIGEDGFGLELIRAMNAAGISAELSVRAPEVPTFTYTKLINIDTGIEDLPRVDFINTHPLHRSLEERLLWSLDSWQEHFDVIVVSDQAETATVGTVTDAIRERLCDISRRDPSKVVWVDSRMRPELFHDVWLKPNEHELAGASRRLFGVVDERRMLEHGRYRALIATCGERGARIVDRNGDTFVPGRKVNAIDSCGAGDSFTAGAATAIAAGAGLREAVRFGNLVASVTVTKRGTGVALPREVLEADKELP